MTPPGEADLRRELADRIRELAEIRIQYAYHFHRAYRASNEPSVAGKNREAEYASLDIYADEVRCEAEIDAVKAILNAS